MKFLACSNCLSMEPPQQPPLQEISNPLVMTKRPVARPGQRAQRPKSKGSCKKRFPALVDALTSWPRRRHQNQLAQQQQQQQHQRRSSLPRTKAVRVYVTEQPRRRQRVPTKTQRLIRMYEERASSPEGRSCLYQEDYVIEPPASFSGGPVDDDLVDDCSLESHQNFKNKLNTLDFKRMNTVALEAPGHSPTPSTSDSAIYRKNSYVDSAEPVPVNKFARKTLLEDFFHERLRIEQTMIDLLNGRDPGGLVLKKSRNDERKVRFKVDDAAPAEQQELRVDVTGAPGGGVLLTDDGRVAQATEIKLRVDPCAKLEDFYVERRMTFLKDKTVEDKALVLKIAAKDGREQEQEARDDVTGRTRELVFRNFGKMSL